MPSDDKVARVSLTVRVRKDVAELARLVARNEAGKPRFLRLNILVEQAIVEYVATMGYELDKPHDRLPSRNHQPQRGGR